MRFSALVIPAVVLALPFSSSAQSAPMPAHGLQTSRMDTSVKPGDDFYRYANGAWLAKLEIPADRTSINSFAIVLDKTNEQLKAIFADVAKSNAAAGTNKRKIADFYASYMNEAAIEQKGLMAAQEQIEAIEAIKTKAQLADALGSSLRADTDALNNTNFHTSNLFGLWVAPGFQESDHYAPYLMQGGVEMPDRAYYLDDTPTMKADREAYVAHLTKMFALAGIDSPKMHAERVMELEKKIAAVHLPLEECEDIHKANNLWPMSAFAEKAPGLDWKAFFAAAGLASQKSMYVWQPTAIAGEAKLVGSEPVEAWKDWMIVRLIDDYATGISKAATQERFAFFGTTITGAKAMRPRDTRAMATTNQWLGDAVGEIYAERYFPAAAKARAQAMVNNLLKAMHARLEAIDWMDPKTKAEAIAKLDALYVGVGYADHWRSYNGLEVKADDLLGNLQRASLFDYKYELSRIGKPVDRKEWCMTPQTVNAVNLPLNNGLNFPAAILQAPFFDPDAPDASNYGAIGTVIGHEISHTFDSEGADFDSKGQVRNWWTEADYAHFKQQTAALAAQFDQYEPFPGVHVNGKQTLGEDIADLGGVAASLDAFHTALGGKTAPKVAGFDGDQQFFLAFGQIWGGKSREAAERNQVLTDPHAPGEYRALTVRNFDAWYKSFNVTPDQKEYLPPAKRVKIW